LPIGYARVVLAVASFCYLPQPRAFLPLYAISCLLDAVDGHAARLLNQCTWKGSFEAILIAFYFRQQAWCRPGHGHGQVNNSRTHLLLGPRLSTLHSCIPDPHWTGPEQPLHAHVQLLTWRLGVSQEYSQGQECRAQALLHVSNGALLGLRLK
jgi:hypothetical protein